MKDDVQALVRLSDILARCEDIKRRTKLPGGGDESDSHHAFSLALIAYQVCAQQSLTLDKEKVLAYALVHDLLEIITGDEPTLFLDSTGMDEKRKRELEAEGELRRELAAYPDLLQVYDEYERLDSPEAATVFVLDKTCTIWTHFHDNGANLALLSVSGTKDIERWYCAQKDKIQKRLNVPPPDGILTIFENSYEELRRHVTEVF